MDEIRLDGGYGRPWFDLWVGRLTQNRVYSMVCDVMSDPNDPESWPGERLQIAVAWAYFGGFEDGNTLFSEEVHLTRGEILDLFRRVLTPREFLIVETVAVPQRFRDMAGADLERLAQRGDFYERVQSMVWMTLTGWRGDVSFDGMADDEARLEEICTDPEKLLEASERLAIAVELYAAGGPPPLAISGATLGRPRPGWRTITYMVPDELVEGSDSNGAALDPPPAP